MSSYLLKFNKFWLNIILVSVVHDYILNEWFYTLHLFLNMLYQVHNIDIIANDFYLSLISPVIWLDLFFLFFFLDPINISFSFYTEFSPCWWIRRLPINHFFLPIDSVRIPLTISLTYTTFLVLLFNGCINIRLVINPNTFIWGILLNFPLVFSRLTNLYFNLI
jgi:hypothetical protein